jgi:hypothetical protein
MIKLIKLLPIIVLLIIGSNSEVNAQCKNFTKKKCMGSLDSYNSNGQYNGAVMFDGEEASLMQTFYSGQEYRLFICAHPSIAEGIFFEVSDYRNNKIYSSEGKNETMFDFNVESTQQLKIRIVVPSSGASGADIKKNGCVSVLVGFKEG